MKHKAVYIIQQFACLTAPLLFAVFAAARNLPLAALCFCGTVVLILGIFHMPLGLFIRALNRLPQTKKQVALTFDDGLSEQTGAILDILAREQITATFFIVGKTVQRCESILIEMQRQGHAIGTHTQNHSIRFPFMSPRQAGNEMKAGIQSLAGIVGESPTLFRPPFGIVNPVIAYTVRRLQLNNAGWSLRSMDTVIRDGEKLKRRILRKLKPGDIVLLHDNRRVTLEILPDLIRQIKKQGYCFVNLLQFDA